MKPTEATLSNMQPPETPANDTNESRGRRTKIGWVLLASVVVPALPFLLLGNTFEQELREASAHVSEYPLSFCCLVGAALAADVFLPIPSGPLTVYAGQVLGWWTGGMVSWLGLTLGAILGYWVARWGGRKLKIVREAEPLHAWFLKYGLWLIVITRPLPLIAEACVLVAGTARYPVLRFTLTIAVSHLILCFGWAWLGATAKDHGYEWLVLVLSVIVPLGLTWLGSGRYATN